MNNLYKGDNSYTYSNMLWNQRHVAPSDEDMTHFNCFVIAGKDNGYYKQTGIMKGNPV